MGLMPPGHPTAEPVLLELPQRLQLPLQRHQLTPQCGGLGRVPRRLLPLAGRRRLGRLPQLARERIYHALQRVQLLVLGRQLAPEGDQWAVRWPGTSAMRMSLIKYVCRCQAPFVPA